MTKNSKLGARPPLRQDRKLPRRPARPGVDAMTTPGLTNFRPCRGNADQGMMYAHIGSRQRGYNDSPSSSAQLGLIYFGAGTFWAHLSKKLVSLAA
jgi:hypothetical protein